MEHIDRTQLYTDSDYRFGYVSKFMEFGTWSLLLCISDEEA
jgi:hypothetical protein